MPKCWPVDKQNVYQVNQKYVLADINDQMLACVPIISTTKTDRQADRQTERQKEKKKRKQKRKEERERGEKESKGKYLCCRKHLDQNITIGVIYWLGHLDEKKHKKKKTSMTHTYIYIYRYIYIYIDI
jgi:hypothetical protein